MIQPQWPGLGPILSSLTLGRSPGDGGIAGALPTAASDGVSSSWWRSTAVPTGGTGSADPSATMWTLLQSIVGLLGQLVGAFTNGLGTATGTGQPGTQPGAQPGTQPGTSGPQQRFADVDISSTGDPHLAETGTRQTPGGTQAVDQHYDSMTSHDDLVSSRSIAGGYRVSTAVTQPDANGVTWNDSATVHTNFGQDSVTMRRDGTFSIAQGNQSVALDKGQTVTLSDGETVTENADGSLVVAAANQQGGTMSTTLHATGNGVDVTTHAHDLAVGGDVVQHGRHAHHGGPHPHQPVATPVTAPVETPAL
jgi:hypothetical protein